MARLVELRCAQCDWAATGVSDELDRTLGWLEQELTTHLQRVHGAKPTDARALAQLRAAAARSALKSGPSEPVQ
ncbi:MAG: hypothetical protein JST54_18810 [Deltaproteobacteria bacterium]|nr:hypothetical protein [Deltaproteobacteria bacterium]